MRNELLSEAKRNNYRPSSEAERIAREEADNVTRRERFYREWCRHETATAPELPPDTCTNCAGTGVGGYHVHAPQEDAVEALRCEQCDGFGYTLAAQESEILKGERK